MTRRIPTMCAAMACAAVLCAQPAPKPLLIEHVRLFDGTRVIANTSVLVEGGRIRSIGPNLARPEGATVVDGAGKTLLPGLIDSHTHTIDEAALQQAPIFGVTTDLDMFTDPKNAAEIKRQQAAGKMADFVDLRSAGYLATAPGGHGTEYGVAVPTLSTPAEAQAWVDARTSEGSDYIKAVYDDSVEYGVDKPRPTLDKATLKALAVAAHKRGKLIVVHIGTLQQAKDAIDAGADGLAHLFVGDSEPDFGKLAAAHHIFAIPTLTVLQSVCGTPYNAALADDPQLRPYLMAASLAALKQSFSLPKTPTCQGSFDAVRQLNAAHVPILAGTDAGNPGTTQGASLLGELDLLVRAGLTPVEVLRAATSAPATAFHLDDRGSIAAGKRADLVLVNGDPTAAIGAMRDIAAVWKNGVAIDRAAWKASMAKQADEKQKQKTAPPPAGSESGWIADFEQSGEPTARFGAGWLMSTDTMAGGKSEGKMAVVPDGAEGSKGCLLVTGEVKSGYAYPWSGVMFAPGAAPMAPANLSSRKNLKFWAKGDGKTYQVMVFTQRLGYRPATQNFVAGAEWKEFTIPFSAFVGAETTDVTAIVWAASSNPGVFQLSLDNIRVE